MNTLQEINESLQSNWLLVSLLLLNVFQAVYWSRQVQKLIDKLMSRNYAEYVSLTNPPLPTVKVKSDLEVDERDVLAELNGMIN